MKPFAVQAKNNLMDSLKYSIDFMDKNITGPSGAVIFGENLIQLIRGYYLFRTGKFLKGGIGEAVLELGLDFSTEDLDQLVQIEKGMRLEEDYQDAIRLIRPDWMKQMIRKLGNVIG